jgi:hypothetical protein
MNYNLGAPALSMTGKLEHRFVVTPGPKWDEVTITFLDGDMREKSVVARHGEVVTHHVTLKVTP